MILTGARPSRVLLDTCAIIYLFNGEAIFAEAKDVIDQAAVLVSPISAWEIGLLARKEPVSVKFAPDPLTWFRSVLNAPGVTPAPFDTEIALHASSLPEPLHRDPADRLLIATARVLSIPLVTRDRLILDYAAAGHVDALRC